MKEDLIVCRFCNKSVEKKELWDHIARDDIGYCPYDCGTCAQTFVNKAELTEHETKNDGHKENYVRLITNCFFSNIFCCQNWNFRLIKISVLDYIILGHLSLAIFLLSIPFSDCFPFWFHFIFTSYPVSFYIGPHIHWMAKIAYFLIDLAILSIKNLIKQKYPKRIVVGLFWSRNGSDGGNYPIINC